MEEKNKKNKGNKNFSKKKTTKAANVKQDVKKKVEVKELNQKVENEKKNLKDKKETASLVTNNEMANLVKIVLVIIAIFLIFYGITSIVTKNKSAENQTGDVTIQYDEILLGTLFEQPNSEYYVLITKEDDYYTSTYTSLLSMYTTKETAIRFYTANLDNGFNKLYEAEESNTKTNNLQELKFSGSALLKIKDKTIVAAYEGNAQIIEHLNNLLK